ncbi:GL14525 [Drosophila persimilis]|uniref:GL14525 n=1 Tax=Drosophila persimilis TaxID=7234 RepID=B4GW69_DROPE|nr:GL14525 [Drosophila persimilis]
MPLGFKIHPSPQMLCDDSHLLLQVAFVSRPMRSSEVALAQYQVSENTSSKDCIRKISKKA